MSDSEPALAEVLSTIKDQKRELTAYLDEKLYDLKGDISAGSWTWDEKIESRVRHFVA